jgi:hypothetical protein
MIENNLNLSICRVKVNCQIMKLKITKLKQHVMPTYLHTDSTDVIENDYTFHHCSRRVRIYSLSISNILSFFYSQLRGCFVFIRRNTTPLIEQGLLLEIHNIRN